MIEYILNGRPIKVKPEDRELFEKANPNAQIQSAIQGGAQVNLQTGEAMKAPDSKAIQPQINQQANTESNLENGSLESLLNNLNNIENEITEGRYEEKLNDLKSKIEKDKNQEHRNSLIEEYNTIFKEYEIKVNDQNIAAQNYNKAVKEWEKDRPTEPAKYAIGTKDLSTVTEKSREEMVELLSDENFVGQVMSGEINISVQNDPEINEYLSKVFNLDKLDKYQDHYEKTHKDKKESRFSEYLVHGKTVKIEVQDIDDFKKEFPNAKSITLEDRLSRIQNDNSLSDKEKATLITNEYANQRQLGEMKDWRERFMHIKNNPELYHDEAGFIEKAYSYIPDWVVGFGTQLASRATDLFIEGPIKAIESEKLAKGIIEGKTREEMMASGELTDLRAFDIVQGELNKFARKHYDEEGKELNVVDLIEKGYKTGNKKHYWEAGALASEQAFSNIYSVILAGANPWLGGIALGTGVYGDEYTRAVTERFKPEELTKEVMNDIRLNTAIKAGGEFVGELVGGYTLRHAAGLIKSGAIEEVVKEANRGFINRGLRGFLGGFGGEAVAEGVTNNIQQAADEWIYGDEKTSRDHIRGAINDGLIGGLMGGPIAGTMRAVSNIDKENLQQVLASHEWRNEVSELKEKIEIAKRDLENSSGKQKDLIQKRIDIYNKKIDAKKRQLNSIFKNKTQAELLDYAKTIDERNIQIGLAFKADISDEGREDARDAIKQLNAKLNHETNGFVNEAFEEYVGNVLEGRRILEERGSTWGFGRDLKLKSFETTEKYLKKIKEDTGKDVRDSEGRTPEGIFLDGKTKTIYIDKQRAAEVGALNVYAHELLHYIMSRNFKTDNESMKPMVDALKEYLVESGNERVIERIEQRMRDNGYMNENGQLKEDRLEEYFEMLSDLMDKRKHGDYVRLDKNKTGSLIKPFKDFLVGLGFKTVNLKDGEAIFDFIQTYSKNVNRKGLLGEITKRGITRVKLETDIKGVEKADKKKVETKTDKLNVTSNTDRIAALYETLSDKDKAFVDLMKKKGKSEKLILQKITSSKASSSQQQFNKNQLELKYKAEDTLANPKGKSKAELVSAYSALFRDNYKPPVAVQHGIDNELYSSNEQKVMDQLIADYEAWAEGKTKPIIKESKSKNPALDKLGKNFTNETWKSRGYNAAMKKIEEDEFVRNIIRKKYKAPSKMPPTFVDDVINSPEFQNMVKRFNKDKWGTKNENESLFAYINSQMDFRAGDVYNRFKDQFEGKKVEADAVTTEGQPVVQVEDVSANMETLTDNIDYFEKEVQPEDTESKAEQSKLRKEIGIGNLGKGEIFKKVRTALATSKAVDERGFIRDYEKNLGNLLEPTIARILNDPAKIKKFRKGILEAIPIKTLVQMQKFLPEKIFVKDHGRQTNLTNLSKFVEKGLLPADILNNTPESKKRRAAGVRVYERLNTTTKQFENYIDAPVVDPKTGKRSGTRGNNRAKVISEVSKAIGRDATPETLTPEFVEDYLNIKDLKGKITPEKVIENISEQIERSPTLKFSETKQAESFQQVDKYKDDFIQAEFHGEGIKGRNPLLKDHKLPEYNWKVTSSEDITRVVKGIEQTVLPLLPRECWFGPKSGSVFTHSAGRDFGLKTSKYKDGKNKGKYKNPKEAKLWNKLKKEILKLKNLPDSSFGKPIPGLSKADHKKIYSLRNFYSKIQKTPDVFRSKIPEIKEFNRKVMAIHRALWTRIDQSINGYVDENNIFIPGDKSNATEIMGYLSLVGNDMGHWHKLGAEIIGYSTEINNYVDKNGVKKKARFEMEHAMVSTEAYLYLINASLTEGVGFEATYDLVADNYKLIALDKAMEIKLTKAITPSGKSLQKRMMDDFNLMTDRFHTRYANELVGAIDGGIDFETIRMVSDGRTMGETFNINSDGNPAIIKYSKSQANNTFNAIEAFNKQAELIKKQNKAIQADLEKRGYKFSKTGDVEGQTPSQMIKIIQADLEAKGYTFVDMDKKGMSTFDFDETLIIDGKNFVVATNPQTGEKVNIKSGEWPTKGPELAEQGYEFNFDDFVNVRGGVSGPLLQKMKNQIKKYGSENVFVLTARPQDAAPAIDGWLKSKGINIPLKNITGLADSRGQAKADWMLEKFAEGYNDMYFVDDALPNVKAVKDVLDQLDIKSKVVQAKLKFSATGGLNFNKILEQTKSVPVDKIFSAQEARKIGVKKGRLNFFVPPSAEDFKGLIYSFLGKGREGDAHAAWFKEKLFDPFAKGIREWNTYKQTMSDDYKALKKEFKGVGKMLNKKVKGTVFTNDNAVRVYLWNKAGFEIPGISEKQIEKLVDHIENDSELKAFADALGEISRVPEGYVEPEGYWVVQSIASDLNNIVLNKGRKDFLAEWIENKNIIFSEQNLNKVEAIYGTGFREALEDMLTRMETGRNRKDGKSKIVNMFLDWINGSVAATMFFNNRSAALQTISTVNFINASDNNIFKAAAAFANQKQFWKDFVFIFNSPMLKQRRAGLQIDISASEITRAFNDGKSKPEAILAYLLEIGFTPTQIADSFAIAAGGATFYRNRLNKYIKEGMSEAKAKEQTWLDFQEIAEETQQSSRPDLISMQQAGPVGRIVLAWQNTPMQMNRLGKKKLSDLVNRRRIPGYTQLQSDVANIQGIAYYFVMQNLIFGALQTGLMFMLFGWDDDEERKRKMEVRVANGALDTILRGTGVYGAAVSTLKNVLMKWKEESEKPLWKRDDWNIAQEAVNLSPPIGSKMRKIMGSIRTEKWNKGVSKEIGLRIENPTLSIASNWVEGVTNFPMARLQNKAWNIEEAITGNHEMWQRVLLGSGWSKWSVGVEDEELEAAKDKAKETRAQESKKIREQKKKDTEKKEQEEKKKKGIKTVRCSGTNSSGSRCSLTTETNKKSWRCFHHGSFKDGQDRDKDGKKEYRCTGKTSSGARCKNKGEYGKKKRCYAHR